MSDIYLGVSVEDLRKHFDAEFYTDLYYDIRNAGVDPFEHYINYGWKEGRAPLRGFDPEFYQRTFINDPEVCTLAHYVKTGIHENYPINEKIAHHVVHAKHLDDVWNGNIFELLKVLGVAADTILPTAGPRFLNEMFDADLYRQKKGLSKDFSDVRAYVSYLALDFSVGMPPGPLFDPEFYRSKASTRGLPAMEQGQTEIDHWLKYGISHQIVPTPFFDEAIYLELNRDLETYPGWLFEHFVFHGQHEGRAFRRSEYLAASTSDKNGKHVARFLRSVAETPDAAKALNAAQLFRNSDLFDDIISHAVELDPNVGVDDFEFSLLPPWHDASYLDYLSVQECIPIHEHFDNLVLVPFCKMGGADYVSGILSTFLSEHFGRTLVLRTDLPDWERSDWFGEHVVVAEISGPMQKIDPTLRTQILYSLISRLNVKRVFNVNSRLAFDTFVRYGSRLSRFSDLYAYYFCADQTPLGVETGYPIWYFSDILPHLKAALIDNADLADRLSMRYALPSGQAKKLKVVYTPTMTPKPSRPHVVRQIETASKRKRPRIVWAGRLDRQKRFDLVQEIARLLPEVDFLCWGKAVLDAPPDLETLPENMTLHDPFTSFEELPLRHCDGWLYTSAWDGIPTILIEIANMGVPVVASAVGGVPELVDDETGWPVAPDASAAEYASAIESMLSDQDSRLSRAQALSNRVLKRHSMESFHSQLEKILGTPND